MDATGSNSFVVCGCGVTYYIGHRILLLGVLAASEQQIGSNSKGNRPIVFSFSHTFYELVFRGLQARCIYNSLNFLYFPGIRHSIANSFGSGRYLQHNAVCLKFLEV